MKIRRGVPTVATLLTGILISALGAYLLTSYRQVRQIMEQGSYLKDLAWKIVYLNEVSTMSARMCAFRGDLSWQGRYDHFMPQLDAAIQEARRFAPGTEGTSAASQTDQANGRLVEMDLEAFDHLRHGRLAAAREILLGLEYEVQKRVYVEGIQRFTQLLREQVQASLGSLRRRIIICIVITGGVLLLLLLSWWRILYVINLQAERLSRWNQDLDAKVTERTREIEEASRRLARDIQERERLEREGRQQARMLELKNQQLLEREKGMCGLLEDLQVSRKGFEEKQTLLEKVNVQLKEMAALKDEFVAKASHELRTPLTAIKEGISLVLDKALGPINEEQQDFLSTVDENIDRLSDLINNMLDISKIEAGRLRLNRRRISIVQLVETTVNDLKPLAGKRTFKMECSSVPEVYADPNRILQVLSNLCSNALKFSKEDGTIHIAVHGNNGIVSVSIRDEGVGIASNEISKLFKKFSQVGSAEGLPRGTGLGLVLCKELVELHNGSIRVDSQAGQGSTFTFTLPIYTSQFALAESFVDQLESLQDTEEQTIAIIALEGRSLFEKVPQSSSPLTLPSRLEEVAEWVRQHVHRGDRVVSLEEQEVVVILAMTDDKGAGAIIRRLSASAQAQVPLQSGAAIYPTDGTDLTALLTKATNVFGKGVYAR